MNEVIFLLILGFIWISFASIQDLRKREVANWLSFSLIIIALGFRFFYFLFSPESSGFEFFYQGLIGLGIFFIIGNILYYGRVFAGGDAKLMMALGTVLPFSDNFLINIRIFIIFIILFFIIGSFYGFIWSIMLSIRNFKAFKNEFHKLYTKNKRTIYCFVFVGVILLLLGFAERFFFIFGIFTFIIPYFYIYAKSVDESSMVKAIYPKNLTEGDWLYNDLKIGKETIKASWSGLNIKEIRKIINHYKNKKSKKVNIREGIPFVPVFLISFLILIYFFVKELIYLIPIY